MEVRRRPGLRLKSANFKYSVFWPSVFLSPFIIFYCVFSLFPVLYSVGLSMTNWDGFSELKFVGFQNYIHIFTKDVNFRKSLVNTVYIMLISFPIAILFGMVLAAILSTLKRCRILFQTMNFLPYIVTPVAVGLIFSFLFDWVSGSVNHILISLGLSERGVNWLGDARYAPLIVALMIIWKYTGYYMALYLAGITAIPDEIYEAAKIDGSNQFHTFVTITVPLLKNITSFIVITSMIAGFQLFDETNLLFTASSSASGAVGGPDRSCLTIMLNFYDISLKSSSRFGYGAAMAVSLFFIICVFTVIYFKISKTGEE